jgi:hypothetical protein
MSTAPPSITHHNVLYGIFRSVIALKSNWL